MYIPTKEVVEPVFQLQNLKSLSLVLIKFALCLYGNFPRTTGDTLFPTEALCTYLKCTVHFR